MHELIQQTKGVFAHIRELLGALTVSEYTRPVTVLSDSSIGKHLRHVIEFYQELYKGYKSGLVNYDARQRDRAIETDPVTALSKISFVLENLDREDRALILEHPAAVGHPITRIETSYQRELATNLEHTVHHMALMRVAVLLVSPVILPVNFGVAESTIKYRGLCVQ